MRSKPVICAISLPPSQRTRRPPCAWARFCAETLLFPIGELKRGVADGDKYRAVTARSMAFVVLLLAFSLLACSGENRKPGAERSSSLAAPSALRSKSSANVEEIGQELRQSVHAKLDCSDCHAPEKDSAKGTLDSNASIGKAECGKCHEAQLKSYEQSVHAEAVKLGNNGAANCSYCHGSHGILPATNPRSQVYRRNLPETCGSCHKSPDVAAKLGIKNASAEQLYLDSLHGRALVERGLLSAPTCADCHSSSHAIKRASDPTSTVHRSQIPKTCGQCHQGPLNEFAIGIHGKKLAEGNAKAPVCSDCHSAHQIVRPDGGFKLSSDALCGKCHASRLRQYLESYHGRASDLGHETVAACFDCHGTHAILPTADPRSTLSKSHRLQTCQKCHENAPPKFTEFRAHADYRDQKNYPVLYWAFWIMTGLIVGTFAVWAIHTFLWMLRTLIVYLSNPRAFRIVKKHVRDESQGKLYTRFRPVDRFCHLLIIVSFLTLVCTGMPLKFHDSAWAKVVFDVLGGAHVAAKLHRFGAILSFMYLGIHVMSLMGPLKRNWRNFRTEDDKFSWRKCLGFVFGPDSPLPNFDDIRDVNNHVKWFFGRGPKPTFDRFTYWEKFDYFAELWGSAFIGLSGLVMWFPTQVSRWLPGWIVNLAQIIHSQEALLAAGFILTFHFFNSHFRLEKFPLDTVMFSGRITEAEMKHERTRQYERLKAEGRLHELEIKDDWSSWKYVFNVFGLTALVLGLLLAVGIFVGLGRLWFG